MLEEDGFSFEDLGLPPLAYDGSPLEIWIGGCLEDDYSEESYP